MPEKPEVITVAKALSKKVIGKKITNTKVLWNNIIKEPSKEEFIRRIKNQTIKDITTRGKFLVFILDTDVLLIHLRMEGKFTFRNIGEELSKHEHVIFTLDNNEEMRFHDVRKFGKMYLFKKSEVYKVKPLVDLGYEYDSKELTKEYLYSKLNTKKLPIKTVLLDQSIITGIGNIYDDEILFLSHISPLRKSNQITMEECESIINNTRITLNKAIELGGTTIKSFTSSEGVHGKFQNELLVHGKKKGLCPKCGSKIINIRINGRGTYYCEKCQK
ncbi:MAG: DNA-formamidopyrimidine glycosylase [Bacilli bacterium]|nr:DNA-formamidopyrimidine glycosylase [Bacilli bacterium]